MPVGFLAPDRYAWSVVLHRESNGGVHVHVLAAQCELETGRSLNIPPPGWQKTFDALRDRVSDLLPPFQQRGPSRSGPSR